MSKAEAAGLLAGAPGAPALEAAEEPLETPAERQERWRSLYIIYFTMFQMSLGFSVALTGVWPYLDKLQPGASKEVLGWAVGANPVGQLLCSPLLGWWANRSAPRAPLAASLALFVAASALYALLHLARPHAHVALLLARFLVGVSSANVAVARSYMSAATLLAERTRAVAAGSLAQVLGFVVGPALQAAAAPLGSSAAPGLRLDMYTAPGWLNAALGLANLLLLLPCCFKDRRIAAREAMRAQGKRTEQEALAALAPDPLSCWTLVGAFFVLVFNFVLLETLATSLTMDQFGWSKQQALQHMGALMSVGALVACATFALIGPLTRLVEERALLLWGGFLLTGLASLLCIPWGPGPPPLASSLAPTVTTSLAPSLASSLAPSLASSLAPSLASSLAPPLASTLATTLAPLGVASTAEAAGGCPQETQPWCAGSRGLRLAQFLLGYGCVSVGYPLGVTLIQTIFSKVLGPRPQGVWQGVLTGAGCLARALGPVCVALLYARRGPDAAFGATAALTLATLLALRLLYARLLPPPLAKPVPPPPPAREMQPLKDNDTV